MLITVVTNHLSRISRRLRCWAAPATALCFVLLLCGKSQAQNFIEYSPHFAALSLGYSEAVEDLGMASLSSPALGLNNQRVQFSASYRQMSLGDYGFRNIQAGFRHTFRKNQHFGLQLHHRGNAAVGLYHLTALYGRKLFKNMNMGLGLNYGQRYTADYNRADQLSMDIAINSQPIKGLSLGLWARNVFPIIGSSFENTSLLLSSKYKISDRLSVYAAFHQQVSMELLMGTGFYYRLHEHLDVKCAYYPVQGAFTLGLGVPLGNWGIHTGSFIQPEFGIQPGAAVYYQK